MKILIQTEREFRSDYFWAWAHNLMESGIPLQRRDFEELLEKKEISFEDDLVYTKAKTTYKIIEGG